MRYRRSDDATGSLSRQYPEAKLSCLQLNRYVNLVEEGIDLAIRIGELEDSTLIARRFGSLQVRFVANRNYLAAKGIPKHPKQLQQHNCLIDSSTTQPNRWRFIDGNRERHVNVSGNLEINSGGLIAELAATGHGIAQLPSFPVQPFLDCAQLEAILEPFQLPPSPISLVYPGNRSANPALATLVQHLLDNAPKFEQS